MNITEGNMSAYVEATALLSLEALRTAVRQLVAGEVDRNNAFLPSAAELADVARRVQASIDKRTAPTLYNGLMNMDWGGGSVDLRGLTTAEQDIVIAAKGITADGRNMALMSLAEIKQEVAQGQIAGPARVMPKLQGMGK